jgi:hypothetical protein
VRWIPVNERLPHDRGEVEALVERKDHPSGESTAAAPEIQLACFSSLMGVWIQFVDAESGSEPAVVTHWREPAPADLRLTTKV